MDESKKFAVDDLAEISDLLADASKDGRNLAAVLLGRRGGLKGGKARAASLSTERRKEIASKAAKARWGKNG